MMKQHAVCPSCAIANPVSAKFCSGCGIKLSTMDAPNAELNPSQQGSPVDKEESVREIIGSWGVKEWAGIAVLCIVVILSSTSMFGGSGSKSSRGASGSASSSQTSTNLSDCINLAKSNGYRSGQCAYSFIKACLTNSRSEVESVLRVDRMVGMVGDGYCPNMPDTYNTAFNKLF